jgi:hypothetical protein
MKQLILSVFLLSSCVSLAQDPCNDLNFLRISYSAFTDTVIIVHVENNSSELFDYPGFVILDANDDTVAVEMVNYFGIGEESVHALNVRPGMHDPLDNFMGTLQLYSGFYDTFECEWDLDQSFCADQPCDSVILGFQNWGGALVVGDFEWRVDDSAMNLVDSGSFTMTVNNQYWFYSLCIEPGTYTYSLTALTDPSGGGPTLTVSSSTSFASPTMSAPLDWFNDPGAEIEFPFFEFCAGNPNAIETADQKPEVIVLRNGDDVTIRMMETIQTLQIFATDGRLLGSFNPNTTQFQLPSGMAKGVYLLRIESESGSTSIKVLK